MLELCNLDGLSQEAKLEVVEANIKLRLDNIKALDKVVECIEKDINELDKLRHNIVNG